MIEDFSFFIEGVEIIVWFEAEGGVHLAVKDEGGDDVLLPLALFLLLDELEYLILDVFIDSLHRLRL